jgi:hypothetical protein
VAHQRPQDLRDVAAQAFAVAGRGGGLCGG